MKGLDEQRAICTIYYSPYGQTLPLMLLSDVQLVKDADLDHGEPHSGVNDRQGGKYCIPLCNAMSHYVLHVTRYVYCSMVSCVE